MYKMTNDCQSTAKNPARSSEINVTTERLNRSPNSTLKVQVGLHRFHSPTQYARKRTHAVNCKSKKNTCCKLQVQQARKKAVNCECWLCHSCVDLKRSLRGCVRASMPLHLLP